MPSRGASTGIATRLRRVVILRSGSWLIVLSVLFLGGLAILDHQFHLPALVRALGLVLYLAGLATLGPPMDRTTAGRVERPGADGVTRRAGLPGVQRLPGERRPVHDAGPGRPEARLPVCGKRRFAGLSRKAERYEFDRAVDARGLKRSILAAVVVCSAAAWVTASAPEATQTAFGRIVLPFGGTAAPTQTKIEILAPQPLPHRMARGEPLDDSAGTSRSHPRSRHRRHEAGRLAVGRAGIHGPAFRRPGRYGGIRWSGSSRRGFPATSSSASGPTTPTPAGRRFTSCRRRSWSRSTAGRRRSFTWSSPRTRTCRPPICRTAAG